jgi:hypothetical protein
VIVDQISAYKKVFCEESMKGRMPLLWLLPSMSLKENYGVGRRMPELWLLKNQNAINL